MDDINSEDHLFSWDMNGDLVDYDGLFRGFKDTPRWIQPYRHGKVFWGPGV